MVNDYITKACAEGLGPYRTRGLAGFQRGISLCVLGILAWLAHFLWNYFSYFRKEAKAGMVSHAYNPST